MGQVDGDSGGVWDQEVDKTLLHVLPLIPSLLTKSTGLSIYSDFSVF